MGPSGPHFNEVLYEIQTFEIESHLKLSSEECHSFCLIFNVLIVMEYWKEIVLHLMGVINWMKLINTRVKEQAVSQMGTKYPASNNNQILQC